MEEIAEEQRSRFWPLHYRFSGINSAFRLFDCSGSFAQRQQDDGGNWRTATGFQYAVFKDPQR